jgi:integrase
MIEDGQALTSAASVLATSAGIPAADVATALRVIGFVDEVLYLGEVIRVISLNQLRFEALYQVLPNLPQLFAAFELVASLDATLCQPASHAVVQTQRFSAGNRTAEGNFLQWLFFHFPLQKYLAANAQELPFKLDVLAGWWIYGAAIRLYGDQIPAWRVKDLTDRATPNTDIKAIEEMLRQGDGDGGIAMGTTEVGFLSWFEKLNAYKNTTSTDHLTAKLVHREPTCVQLPKAIQRLASIQELSFKFLTNLDKTIPTKSMPPLGERELLRSHWYFPRPSEMKALQVFLEENSKPGTPAHTEACLIGLAIFSCRTTESVLHWRVYQGPADLEIGNSIVWTTQYSASGYAYLAPAWRKSEHGQRGAEALLVLPFRFLEWLGSLDVGIGSPRLVDLLPISEIEWSTRSYTCLAKALNCSVERATLITRDLIPRLVYEDTVNSALVKFFRSSEVDHLRRDERIALSHYVHIGSGRALKSFSNACKVVFGEVSLSKNHKLTIPLGRPALQRSEMKTIQNALIAAREEAASTVALHMSTALLTLFVCLAGTGPRRQTTPFPFPWDFNIPEKLAFIADKLITGSEARFVPLSSTVIFYLELYTHHLEWLSLNDKVSLEVRNYANLVRNFLRTAANPASQAALHTAPLSAGVFFAISSDGQRIKKKTISSFQVDEEILRLTGIKRVVQRLRPSIASFCWESGASGRAVQAFLGHQPELHSNGPASTWSIRSWADDIETFIEEYLRECGIAKPEIEGPHRPKFHSGAIPPLMTSTGLGYEGRQRERALGEQRAKAVIRREINTHILIDDDTVFTESDVQKIIAIARAELRYDSAGSAQIAGEVKKQLASIRQRRTVRVTARSTYLGVTVSGPIGVDYSRLFRVACVFRQLWESNVGRAIGNRQFDYIERLAQLSISLVCFDAVLLPLHIQGVIEGLQTGAPPTYASGMTLRARILSSTHDYNFSIRPGLISSALAHGTQPPPTEDHPELWKLVKGRIALILRKLLNSNGDDGWDLQQLCLVYRPYWLVRQPAAMYAVAIGDFRGPAADPISEAALLGSTTEPSAAKLPPMGEFAAAATNRMFAYQDLRKLFSETRGVLEKGERKKKKQRAALRDALKSSELAVPLNKWRAETQIVELLLLFIGRLLDNGGKRVKALAFSSLEKYFSLVAKEMIRIAWTTDFESIEKPELTSLLETASSNLSDKAANTVLAYFASHLRDEVGAPYCGPKWSKPTDVVRVRSSLVLPHQQNRAISLLKKASENGSRDGALMIAAMAGYGVRPAELRGVSVDRFDTEKPEFMIVKQSRIADLKSSNGRRVICSSLSAEKTQNTLKEAFAKATASPHKRQYLFEDSTGDNIISNANAAAQQATLALRIATNNPIVVPYHLRHTFGSALVLGIFAIQNPNLHEVATRLIGSGYKKRIADILQAPSDWPFAIDAAGALMGHAGVTDLLNTYSHISCFVIAAWSKRWQHDGVLSDQRLAAMIGRERTGVTKMRLRLSSLRDTNVNWQGVVRHLIQPSSASTARATEEHEEDDNLQNNWELAWVAAPRILLDRLQSDKSLAEMREYGATTLHVPTVLISKIAEQYASLVATTELDDFEPSSSELTRPISVHSTGVGRGRLERDRFVARTQSWLKQNPDQRDSLYNFLQRWKMRVDAADPRIVCTNQFELEQAIFLLTSLGADASQLAFVTHGDPSDQWLENVFLTQPGTRKSRDRASRGSRKIFVKEVSIGIRQKIGQEFPDGRDLHRALISICILIDAGA